MKWANLTKDACPNCGSPLVYDEPIYKCVNEEIGCTFIITEEKKKQLSMKVGDRRYLDRVSNQDNLDALNNL